MKKAVVLLSGGLDSTTTLFLALSRGYKVSCLIFDYGQRHKKEIARAKKIASRQGCRYKLIKFKLPWPAGALVDEKTKIPLDRNLRQISKRIPATYVPARNTIFLSFALSWAEAIGAGAVFIGANSIDYSGYPDCRPNYFSAFRKLAGLATKSGPGRAKIKILTPLDSKSKAQIVRMGKKLGVRFEETWSCYKGTEYPCGKCDSCQLRAKGFSQAGIRDPLYGQRKGL